MSLAGKEKYLFVLVFYVYQLEIPDTLREKNESVPDTRYTIQRIWH